jgi:S1-C subfamily serine protease
MTTFQEDIFFAAVRVSVNDGSSIGTAFIYEVRIPGTASARALLVSNKHVFGGRSGRVSLNFHKKRDDGSGPDLGRVVPVSSSDFSQYYTEHPDPTTDLACLDITTVLVDHPIYFRDAMESALCLDYPACKVSAGTEVWFVGYPAGYYDQTNNLPILRRGYLASIPALDFNGAKQFLIDADIIPGSSGSPVFATAGTGWWLIGVLAQALTRRERIRVTPESPEIEVAQALGLGVVLKAELVKQLGDHVVRRLLEQQ